MWFDNHDVPWVKPLAIAALVIVPAHRFIAEQPIIDVGNAAVSRSGGIVPAVPTSPSIDRAINGAAVNETFPAITDKGRK